MKIKFLILELLAAFSVSASINDKDGVQLDQPNYEQKKSFVVRTINPHSILARDVEPGPEALRRAYAKYKVTPPANLARAVQRRALIKRQLERRGIKPTLEKRQSTGAPEYLSPIQIGGQTVNLDFDTGSSDLWVWSDRIGPGAARLHKVFNSSKSSTFQVMPGSTWQIRYGDGSGAKGIVGTDQVSLAGITVNKLAVELADDLTSTFLRDQNLDGILGLAFPVLNSVKPTPVRTLFDQLAPDLVEPLFSVNLRSDADVGSYQFGGIDNEQFDGNLTITPVDNSAGFWAFRSKKFAVGNKVIDNPRGSPAIADTGTSLALVDDIVAKTYYDAVPGARMNENLGGYTYPCNTKLPDISLAIGDYMAKIPGSLVTFGKASGTQCFGGIQSKLTAPFQILGDTLFRSQYVVFDQGDANSGPRLRMALKKNP